MVSSFQRCQQTNKTKQSNSWLLTKMPSMSLQFVKFRGIPVFSLSQQPQPPKKPGTRRTAAFWPCGLQLCRPKISLGTGSIGIRYAQRCYCYYLLLIFFDRDWDAQRFPNNFTDLSIQWHDLLVLTSRRNPEVKNVGAFAKSGPSDALAAASAKQAAALLPSSMLDDQCWHLWGSSCAEDQWCKRREKTA